MKTISNIFISHLVLLVLFGGAALALAQTEETSSEGSTETEVANPDTAPVAEEEAETIEDAESRQTAQEERQATQEERQQERQDNMEERQATQEERQEARSERLETRRANLDDQARQRITNLAALMSNRIDAVIARMQNISTRLESRIEKMSNAGFVTEEADSALASANLSIETARQSISNIDAEVAKAVGAEDVRQTWQEVSALFIEVRDQLRTAQQEFRNTVSALKTAERQPAPEDEIENN